MTLYLLPMSDDATTAQTTTDSDEPLEYEDMDDAQQQMYDAIARYSKMTVLELFLKTPQEQDTVTRFMRATVTPNRVEILEYLTSLMVDEPDDEEE